MADTHKYDVSIDGETYTVESPTPLSDAEAYGYAKTQVPFDVKKQNAIMQANMAKQPPGTGVEDTLTSFATSGPMGDFNDAMAAAGRGEGAKAVHKAVVGTGKVLAPAALPLLASPAGLAVLGTSVAGGAVGDTVARGAASLVTDNPDYQDVAGDLGGLVGGGAGAKLGGKFSGPVLKFAGNVLKNPEPLRVQAGKAVLNFADRDAAEQAARTAALDEAAKIEAKTKESQHAEAIRTNKRLTEDAKLAAKKAAPAKPGKSAPADVAQMMRDRLAAPAGEDANVPVPDRGNQPMAEPQGTGLEHNKDLPLYEQQARMEAEQSRSGKPPAEPPTGGRPVTPTHPQKGAGGRGSEAPTPADVANSYAEANGFAKPAPHTAVKVDPKFGAKVADAYDAMKHDPSDPETKRAYDALAKEVTAQFEHITSKGGLKAEPWTGEGQPYANSKEMRADVEKNGHLFYYPTESGFGTAESAGNPLLAKGKNGMPVNDMLRVVHDYFAHAVEGHQFGPNGEENAFLAHLKMLTPDAGRALATETRGQNSFVNFGKHMRNASGELLKPGDAGYLSTQDRPFAAQKTGLLPDELLPESLRRGGTPQGGGDGEMLSLEHRSGQEGLTSLDPEKHGTGQTGAEKQRKAAFPEDYIPRSYTNVAGGTVEPRFAGSKVYTTQVPKSKVYDFREDPLHLIAEAKSRLEPGQTGRMPSIAEKLAHEKGFTTVTFDGNTYQHTAPLPLAAKGAPVAKSKLNTLVDTMEVVGDEGGPNASGESAASREALSRQSGMKAKGEQFAVRKGSVTRPLVGPDAVDYNPQPGEQFGVTDKDGNFRVLSLGEAREKLIGNRGAGHMTKANREALFNALMKRMKPTEPK